MPLDIALHRRIEEFLHFGEGDNFIELAQDLSRRFMPRMAPLRKMFSRPVSSG